MQISVAGRQTGKTTWLIGLSALHRSYIVVHNKKECSRVVGMARDLGLSIPTPITYDEFIRHEYYSKGIGEFLIDNVDMLLRHMTDVPIRAITLTEEEA